MGINAAGVAKASPSAQNTKSIIVFLEFSRVFSLLCAPQNAAWPDPHPGGNFQQGISSRDIPASCFYTKNPNKTHPSQNSYSSSAPFYLSLDSNSGLLLPKSAQRIPGKLQQQAGGTAESPLFPPGFVHLGKLGTILCFHGLFIPGNFQVTNHKDGFIKTNYSQFL